MHRRSQTDSEDDAEDLLTEDRIMNVIDQAILSNRMLENSVDMRTQVISATPAASLPPPARGPASKRVIPDDRWANVVKDASLWQQMGDEQLARLQQGGFNRAAEVFGAPEHTIAPTSTVRKIPKTIPTSLVRDAGVPRGLHQKKEKLRAERSKRDNLLQKRSRQTVDSTDSEGSEECASPLSSSDYSTTSESNDQTVRFAEASYPTAEHETRKTVETLPNRLQSTRCAMTLNRAVFFGGRMFEHINVTKDLLALPYVLQTWKNLKPRLELMQAFSETCFTCGIDTVVDSIKSTFTQELQFIGSCGLLLGSVKVGEIHFDDSRQSIPCVLGNNHQNNHVHQVIERVHAWQNETSRPTDDSTRTINDEDDNESGSDDDDDDDDEDGSLADSSESFSVPRPGLAAPREKLRPRIIVVTGQYSELSSAEMMTSYKDQKENFKQLEDHPEWVHPFASDLLCLRMVYMVLSDISANELEMRLQTNDMGKARPKISEWILHRSHADLQGITMILIDAQFYFFMNKYW